MKIDGGVGVYAGEVCDGFLAHGFSTPRYMPEVTIPALERGLARSGRSRADFELTCPGFMARARPRSSRSFAPSDPLFPQVVPLRVHSPSVSDALEAGGEGRTTNRRSNRWDLVLVVCASCAVAVFGLGRGSGAFLLLALTVGALLVGRVALRRRAERAKRPAVRPVGEPRPTVTVRRIGRAQT